MPVTHVPKYPVVDPDPSVTKAIGNFNAKDLSCVFAGAVLGFAAGWFGASKQLRSSNARFLAGIGIFAGLAGGVLNSTQRLVGLLPNDAEISRYGIFPPEKLAIANEKLRVPNLPLIDSSVNDK